MKRFFMAVAITLLAAVISYASTFYRCQMDGRTVISNAPCPQGNVISSGEIQVAPAQPPAPIQRNQQPSRPYQGTLQSRQARPQIKSYDINHRATERSGVVEISGRITGPQCSSLRVDAFARTSDGGIVKCVTVTSLSANSTLFSCADTTRRTRDGRNREWFVSSISVTCQD